jgi:hypothetical protein
MNNYALIENNGITDCGWHDVEYHWETAGIKLLINTGTLVRNNRVVNNIFVDAEKPINFGDPGNTADHNIYLSAGDRPGAGPLPGEAHSVTMRGDVSLGSRDLVLTWKPGQDLPTVSVIENCDRDFAGRERTEATTVPGPFIGLSHAATFKLDGQ